MQNAAVTHEKAAGGVFDDVAGGKDSVLIGHPEEPNRVLQMWKAQARSDQGVGAETHSEGNCDEENVLGHRRLRILVKETTSLKCLKRKMNS